MSQDNGHQSMSCRCLNIVPILWYVHNFCSVSKVPSGKELLIWVIIHTHCIFYIHAPICVSFLTVFPWFGFDDGILVPIATVPGFCLNFYLSSYRFPINVAGP